MKGNRNRLYPAPMGGPPTASAGGPNGAANGGDHSAQQQLRHDPGVSMDWSAMEQSILDDGLAKYASETSSILKYIRIAALLPDKTVRDVALRCHWKTKKENGRKHKADENGAKKSKEKKEKAEAASKQLAPTVARSGMPMYTPPPPPIDNDDGISNEAIGGPTGQLFEQNSQVIVQIRANLAACQLQGNTDLLVRFRDNILAILDGMTNMPGIMSQMPPLPVKLNVELADSILPESLPPTSAHLQA